MLLALVGSVTLLPSGSTGSDEMWLVSFGCDRRKICPIVPVFLVFEGAFFFAKVFFGLFFPDGNVK